MEFKGICFILNLFYFINFLFKASVCSDHFDLERIELKHSVNSEETKIEVTEKTNINKISFENLNPDILGYIGSFLNVPQRELGRLTKYFRILFKDSYPYSRYLMERFGITELSDAVSDKDLNWFSDKLEYYKEDPNIYFSLLMKAIYYDKIFSMNSEALCQYYLRNVKKFNCDSLVIALSYFRNEENLNTDA